MDDIGRLNRAHWEWAVRKAAGCTKPWTEISREMIERFIGGEGESLPVHVSRELYPREAYCGVEGKDVLCLGTGGGQQSVLFGLLGAHVTVVDITPGQLDGDREAADSYGYQVTCIQHDMRDLSFIEERAFDLVYQGNCLAWIPDVGEIYAQVSRVLRPGGRYRADFSNPGTEFVEPDTWDGSGYRITEPYATERVDYPPQDGDPGCVQFRHSFSAIFNGLIDAGLTIDRVEDSPHLYEDISGAEPGGWDHWLGMVGSFAILATRR